MNRNPVFHTILLSLLLLVAGCGASGQRNTVRLLNDRLQSKLAPDIKAGRVAVQATSDGAQVVVLDNAPITNDSSAVEQRTSDIRAGIVEALLEPSLMRVQVADTSALSESQRFARVNDVEKFIAAYGLGSVLRPATTQSGQVPQGLLITVSADCPPGDGRTGYSSRSKPICE